MHSKMNNSYICARQVCNLPVQLPNQAAHNILVRNRLRLAIKFDKCCRGTATVSHNERHIISTVFAITCPKFRNVK